MASARSLTASVIGASSGMTDLVEAELVEAGGLYAHMWADYQQAVQWKIQKEVA